MSNVNKDPVTHVGVMDPSPRANLPNVALWGTQGLVWGAEDVMRLHSECRIVGSLIGCPPHAPLQPYCSSLPLLLSPEEVRLVVEKQMANVHTVNNLNGSLDSEEILRMHNFMENNFQDQVEVCLDEKRNEVLKRSRTIVEGKKRKLIEQCTEDRKKMRLDDEALESELIEQELNKIKPIQPDQRLVQIFLEPQWCPRGLSYSRVCHLGTPRSCHRYHVYKDLWSRGFYITNGTKFGVDFLVYTSDPILNHAKYLVVCDSSECDSNVPQKNENNCLLMAKARLAHSVNKLLLMAKTSKEDELVSYQLVKAVITKRTRL